MTPQAFVEAYLALTQTYIDMDATEREAVTTAFVKARSINEGWRVLVSEDS